MKKRKLYNIILLFIIASASIIQNMDATEAIEIYGPNYYETLDSMTGPGINLEVNHNE